MKLSALQAALGSAAVILSASGCAASSAHQRRHSDLKRSGHVHGHAHSARAGEPVVKKRSGPCLFPDNEPHLVPVTPHQMNAGWAMSVDQECTPGKYCPFACKSGMVMAQWKPGSKYAYPESMDGGLFCNPKTGQMEKPFPEKPCCVQGTGTVSVRKEVKGSMSWCQTVLPGNEEMSIWTEIADNALSTLAVPDYNYWDHTSAHYYINPLGSTRDDCTWGTQDRPFGNWAPYVAGANTVANGDTYVQISWNPKWLELGHSASTIGFGLKIECEGQCNGLPCEIDPRRGANVVISNQAGVGAGDGENKAKFCVVTVPRGSKAVIIVFDVSGNGHQDGVPDETGPKVTAEGPPKESPKEGFNGTEQNAEEHPPPPPPVQETQPVQESTPAQEPPSNSPPEVAPPAPGPEMPPAPSTPGPAPTTTSEPSPPPPPTSPVTPTTAVMPTSSQNTTTTTVTPTSSRKATTSLATASFRNSTALYTKLKTTAKSQPTLVPGVFHENSTTTTKSRSSALIAPTTISGPQHRNGSSDSSGVPPKPQVVQTAGVAGRQRGSAVLTGLIVALVAAGCF